MVLHKILLFCLLKQWIIIIIFEIPYARKMHLYSMSNLCARLQIWVIRVHEAETYNNKLLRYQGSPCILIVKHTFPNYPAFYLFVSQYGETYGSEDIFPVQ